MKPSDFKKIIKEAVKEAIQEELKDILLEAVRAPKTIVTESLATLMLNLIFHNPNNYLLKKDVMYLVVC
jgi:hypothetical protein